MVTYSAEVMDVAGNSVKIVAYENRYADIQIEQDGKGRELNLDAESLEDLAKAAVVIALLMRHSSLQEWGSAT